MPVAFKVRICGGAARTMPKQYGRPLLTCWGATSAGTSTWLSNTSTSLWMPAGTTVSASGSGLCRFSGIRVSGALAQSVL